MTDPAIQQGNFSHIEGEVLNHPINSNKSNLKGTESVLSSDPPCKDDNA